MEIFSFSPFDSTVCAVDASAPKRPPALDTLRIGDKAGDRWRQAAMSDFQVLDARQAERDVEQIEAW